MTALLALGERELDGFPCIPPRCQSPLVEHSSPNSPCTPGADDVFSPETSQISSTPQSLYISKHGDCDYELTSSSSLVGLGIFDTTTSTPNDFIELEPESEVTNAKLAKEPTIVENTVYGFHEHKSPRCSEVSAHSDSSVPAITTKSRKFFVPQPCLQCRLLSLRCSLTPELLPPDYNASISSRGRTTRSPIQRIEDAVPCSRCCRSFEDVCIQARICRAKNGKLSLVWHKEDSICGIGTSSVLGGGSLTPSCRDRGQYRQMQVTNRCPPAQEDWYRKKSRGRAAELLEKEEIIREKDNWALPSWKAVPFRFGPWDKEGREAREARKLEISAEKMRMSSMGM